jgi:heat shock protein HslJ
MKRPVFLLAVLLLASIPVLAGCGATPPFEDVNWVMEAYGELGSLETALPDVEVTLFFDSAKKQFTGYNGINTYSGSYKVKGSQISFPGGVALTQLKGDEQVQQQEGEYVGMFSSADSLEIVDGKLHLICDGKLIIYHEK